MRVDYFSVISTTTLFEFMIVTKIWKKNNRRIAVRVRNIKKKTFARCAWRELWF